MLKFINEPQKKDIADEIDELISQSENMKGADIYAKYNFLSKILTVTKRQASETLESYAKLTQSYHELTDKYEKLAYKYAAVAEEDRGTPELLFTLFSLDPAGTLEMFLKNIDRKQKIENQSGETWKWQLALKFRHRLIIAWKLIFRPAVKGRHSNVSN